MSGSIVNVTVLTTTRVKRSGITEPLQSIHKENIFW